MPRELARHFRSGDLPLKQRAIGGAGPGCAADRTLSAIVALMPFDEILNARHHGRRASIPRGLSR